MYGYEVSLQPYGNILPYRPPLPLPPTPPLSSPSMNWLNSKQEAAGTTATVKAHEYS